MYQPPEDYLDILVAAGGGGWASHLIHAAQRRCSNEVKSGWRGGMVGGMKGTERVEGGGALELAATCCSTSIMGTLQTTSAI